jgi:hypothetical protein
VGLFEVRIHGSAAAEVVTSAELLALAAFLEAGTRGRSRASAPGGPGAVAFEEADRVLAA